LITYFATICLFCLSNLCYRIDYHNLYIKSLVEKLNNFLKSYFRLLNDVQDKEFLNSIKIPSIYFKILNKFWKKKGEDGENNFYVKLNCFPLYFLKCFSSQYYSFSLISDVKTFAKGSTNKRNTDSSSNIRNVCKSSISCTKLKAKEFLIDVVTSSPSSTKQKNFILEEFSLYFNTKLMKWRSSILLFDKSVIKCRVCEKDMYPSDLCLHSFQCSRKNFFSLELKKLNTEIGDIIFMANDILK